MSGHKNWNEITHKSTPEQRAIARQELDQELALHELRQARGMTQTQLALALEIKQSGVSRIEHQTDLFVSTMRSYVEALGGELAIHACFGDTAIAIRTFEEIGEPSASEQKVAVD